MLERATTCVQPTAQHFLGRVDLPTRSNRLLLQSFWKHSGHDLAGPTWWSDYLTAVRQSSNARLRADQPLIGDNGHAGLLNLDLSGIRFTLQDASRDRARAARCNLAATLAPQDGARQHRPYTKSHSLLQDVAGTPNLGGSHLIYQAKAQHEPPEDLDRHRASGSNPELRSPMIYAKRLDILLEHHRQDDYDRVWRLFVGLHDQRVYAKRVLRYLSSSSDRIDLERAIGAYKMLPTEARTIKTYRNVMKAALSRRKHAVALEIHREALVRGLGIECSRVLLGHLIRHKFWKTLSIAYQDLHGSNPAQTPVSDEELSEELPQKCQPSHYFYGGWTEVDENVHLPEILLSLAHKLENTKTAILLDTSKIRTLAKFLLHRVVGSARVMSVINPRGFLLLFEHFEDIGLLNVSHYFEALVTIRRMAGYRNRSQLAALIYRNLRFRFPMAIVPRWVYGSLISVFADAGQPSDALRFLLDEFALMHNEPDPRAFQKVMTACARLGDVKGVNEVLEEYCAAFGKPKDLGYLTPLIYVHSRIGDVRSAREQFFRLRDDFGVYPDIYCWNVLLVAYARAGDTSGAFDLFREMQENRKSYGGRGQVKVKPDAYTFGTLMGICANNGDTETLHNLVEMARDQGVRGTHPMVDTLVQSYCLNDELDSAEELVETTTGMNLEGSPTRMWNILLKHYAFQADSEDVLRVQEKMKKMGVKADSMTYATLMTALVVIGKTKDAAQILRSLHFNERLTATLVHYSIVLHGYAQEGNRDMVSVIYNEIIERFPKPSISARLALLHTQGKRDLSSWRRWQLATSQSLVLKMPRTLEFLTETLLSIDSTDYATKEPQPGLSRRSPRDALPSAYMDFLINILNCNGAFSKAQQLLERCLSLIASSTLGDNEKQNRSVQLLTAHLIGCSKQKQYGKVDDIWNTVLRQVLSRTTPATSGALPQEQKSGSRTVDPPSSPIVFQSPASSAIPSTPFFPSQPPRLLLSGAKISPAYRYSLSAPITRYMQALADQGKHHVVPGLVEDLEKAGFALSSKNYNTYVQTLAQSREPKLQVHAFEVFEAKFLDHVPHWSLLRRGKWMEWSELGNVKSEMATTSLLTKRRLLEKIRPSQLMPTYFTMVHLGAVMLAFQRRSAQDDPINFRYLRNRAPGTVAAVSNMPYLRDRVQGMLLRGHEARGDFVKRPHLPPIPERAGLRGSMSPMDHLPIAPVYDPHSRATATTPRDHRFDSEVDKLSLAEQYSGEVHREKVVLARSGQLEHDAAYHHRLKHESKEKLALIEQIRRDARASRMTSDIYFGEPHIDSISTPDYESQSADSGSVAHEDGKLLNPISDYNEKFRTNKKSDARSPNGDLENSRSVHQKDQYPRAITASQPFHDRLSQDLSMLTALKAPKPISTRQRKAFLRVREKIARTRAAAIERQRRERAWMRANSKREKEEAARRTDRQVEGRK